jgi:hypothetical protein
MAQEFSRHISYRLLSFQIIGLSPSLLATLIRYYLLDTTQDFVHLEPASREEDIQLSLAYKALYGSRIGTDRWELFNYWDSAG